MPRIEPFEKHPLLYEQWFDENPWAYQSELEAVRELLPREGEGVEIGVGTGRFAAPLKIATGVDPSEKMRRIASQKGIKTINGVAENLPLNDETFDFALMTTTICFLDDVKAAFCEAYRILKSGGCLVVSFVDKNSSIGKIYQKKKEKSLFYKPATFYSVGQVVEYLKNCKFRDLQFVQTLFKNLDQIKDTEPVREGYGEGSFVVIKASK